MFWKRCNGCNPQPSPHDQIYRTESTKHAQVLTALIMETSNCNRSTPLDFVCPACGLKDSNGGCRQLSRCIEALSGWESNIIREMVHGFDGLSRSSSIQVLLAGLKGLDLLGVAWLICDEAGYVLNTSPVGKEILSCADGLALGADGRISCRSRQSKTLLHEAIQRVARSAISEENARQAVLIRRQSRKKPLTLLLKLIGTDATRVLPEPVVLILILDPSVHTGASHQDLFELYRFTVAETELANLLMTGKSLRDCSHELGICYSTARTHLDNMFKKTGVRHQAHLVSLLLRSIGLLRPAHS